MGVPVDECEVCCSFRCSFRCTSAALSDTSCLIVSLLTVSVIFMLMFAAITPLLMTGAYAERLKWKGFIWLTILWELLVYYPLAHW